VQGRLDLLEQALARILEGGQVGVDQAEFIAAEAVDHDLRAGHRAQAGGNRGEQAVADLMAIGIVDRLETVEIEHADGKGARPSCAVRRSRSAWNWRRLGRPVRLSVRASRRFSSFSRCNSACWLASRVAEST
jgi:hypothetical protein